jgi:hypothetical protein
MKRLANFTYPALPLTDNFRQVFAIVGYLPQLGGKAMKYLGIWQFSTTDRGD